MISNKKLLNILENYLKLFPKEHKTLEPLIVQLKSNEKLYDRHNYNGHITGAALVLSPDKKQILLIAHNFFKRWMQPGGHWEAEEADPLKAAKRETEEESGVKIGKYLEAIIDEPLVPIDIGVHLVPSGPPKNEPPHTHYDFRYVFVADNTRLQPHPEESEGARWFSYDSPEAALLKDTLSKLKSFNLIQ